MRTVCTATLVALWAAPSLAFAADPPGRTAWCGDTGTYCWSQTSPVFNGVRLLAEPKLGYLMPVGDNKLRTDPFTGAVQLGIEANIYGGIASLQGYYLAPFTAGFDDQSPVYVDGLLANSDKSVDVEVGVGAGVSLFQGVLAIGVVTAHLDSRDFTSGSNVPSNLLMPYFNFQPVSGARALIQTLKPASDP